MFSAQLATGGSVMIGDAPSPPNVLVVEIFNETDEPAGFRLGLEIGTGPTTAALLAADTTAIGVELGTEGGAMLPALTAAAAGVAGAGRRVWRSSQRTASPVTLPPKSKNARLRLRLKDFVSLTPPGTAKLKLTFRPLVDGAWSDTEETAEVDVKKQARDHDDPLVHYFTVDRDFQLHSGDPVVLSFYARGFTRYSLSRNNQPVRSWEPETPRGQVTGSFSDAPSITTVYRLRAVAGEEASADDDVRQEVVQVIVPGWNRLGLPQGYPAQLFPHKDFAGNRGERLYGIFLDADGKPVLYSSATGVDDWTKEPGTLSEKKMAWSVGIAFDNKLWLIGGSSCNENEVGGEVWRYEAPSAPGAAQEAAETPERDWVRMDGRDGRPNFGLGQQAQGRPTSPPIRMGHACVVVPGRTTEDPAELWLIGGYARGQPLDDVWVLRGDRWITLEEAHPPPAGATAKWPGRRMHAAASVRVGSGEPEVWVFGGVGAEGKRASILSDFWSWSATHGWRQRDPFSPSQGAPLASTFVVERDRSSDGERARDRLFLAATFLLPPAGDAGNEPVLLTPTDEERRSNVTISRIFELQPDNKRWEAQEVRDGWERFEGSWFRMQAVAFNRFLFVWSLHPGISLTQPPKLNILVPS